MDHEDEFMMTCLSIIYEDAIYNFEDIGERSYRSLVFSYIKKHYPNVILYDQESIQYWEKELFSIIKFEFKKIILTIWNKNMNFIHHPKKEKTYVNFN